MINGTVVIEPTDSAIKIIVGSVLNNMPIILYTTSLPNNGLIKNGVITDIKALANLFHTIMHIADKKARIRFDIKSAVLVLPPLDLEVYSDKKTTNVISNESKIEIIDIKNVMLMMNSNAIDPNCSIVDISPLKYYLDNGMCEQIPIGLRTRFLGVNALIYTLPKKLYKSYRSTLEIAGIKIKRTVLANTGIARLLANQKDLPFAYIYVDIGSSYTTLSLISKNRVYGSTYFMIGGNELSARIADAFKIDIKEAEKIKRRYGYDSRIISFDPIIASSKNFDDTEKNITVKDLNAVIKEYFEDYFVSFELTLEKLVSSYPEEKRKFPMIIGGGASRLNGFLEFLKEKYQNIKINRIPLNIIGARHEKYLNCVGALMVFNISMNKHKEMMDNQNKVNNQINNQVNNGVNNTVRKENV